MPSPAEERRREAARALTGLLEQRPAFSFIRLGDGEVLWLQNVLKGEEPSTHRPVQGAASIELTRASYGLERRHAERFRAALNGATYLDFCDSIPYVREHVHELGIRRAPGLFRNESPETSNIIFEWTYYELGGYLRRHRCLLAGAEAGLLRELSGNAEYRALAAEILPTEAELHFHQIRDDGRDYSAKLDLIKEDLRQEIARTGADTLFLSLATGAKVLCHELAQELGIRAIDFGSMGRALAYAGTSGYQACRDMHNPFFFRVPYATYMPALERAWPAMTTAELAARAHAQLALELHRHAKFTFNPSDGAIGSITELSPENLRHFREGRREHRARYRARFAADPEARRLEAGFRRWCWKKGIGLSGRAFLALARLKSTLRQAGRKLRCG